jgi:hypothetical protein
VEPLKEDIKLRPMSIPTYLAFHAMLNDFPKWSDYKSPNGWLGTQNSHDTPACHRRRVHAWAGCSQLGKLLVTPERRIVLRSTLPMGRLCVPPKPPGFFLQDFGVAQSTFRRRLPIHPSHRVMADSSGMRLGTCSGAVGGPIRRVSVIEEVSQWCASRKDSRCPRLGDLHSRRLHFCLSSLCAMTLTLRSPSVPYVSVQSRRGCSLFPS